MTLQSPGIIGPVPIEARRDGKKGPGDRARTYAGRNDIHPQLRTRPLAVFLPFTDGSISCGTAHGILCLSS